MEKKKSCFCPGSNRGPCACEAHVITATPQKPLGQNSHTMRQLTFWQNVFNNDVLVVMVSVLVVMVSVQVVMVSVLVVMVSVLVVMVSFSVQQLKERLSDIQLHSIIH